MSRFVPIVVAVVGLLALYPGAVFLVSTLQNLNPEDAGVALTPLASVPLDSIAQQRVTTIKVAIPDTAQWKRIRRKWGAPDFVISAAAPGRQLAYCLAELKMRIEVYQHGNPVQTESSGPGYGYSTHCEGSSLRFRAAPGTELLVSISLREPRTLPRGELIVANDWFNTKDKLVGTSLDEELRPIAISASIVALSLVLIALALELQRRRGLRR